MSDTRPWAVFVDFDGTLVDIAERPEAVVVEPELPAVLLRLRTRLDGALAVVTGRPIADIDRFLPGLALDACGLHGLERRIDRRPFDAPDLPSVAAEVAELRHRFRGHAGVVIEDKGVGVAIHWRMAPELETEAAAAVADIALRLGPAFRIQDGKAVRELVPARAGKGAGIRAMMEREPYRGRRPFFAGDDRTDEDGFAAVVELGGVGCKIGPGPTLASHRSVTAAAFRAWLPGFPHKGDALGPLMLA